MPSMRETTPPGDPWAISTDLPSDAEATGDWPVLSVEDLPIHPEAGSLERWLDLNA